MHSSRHLTLIGAIFLSCSLGAQTLYTPAGTVGTSSTSFVGVGTSAPDAPLTFSSVAGEKIHLYSNGSSLYSFGVYSNELRVVSGANGAITFGNQSGAGGTFSEYARITQSGALGLGMMPTANLDVASGGTATFRAGVPNNAANTVAQIRSSLAVVGANSAAQSVNGAVAYDYYNAGTSPSWSGALLVYNGVDDPNTNYDLPQARRGTLVFQNVSAGLIATNGGSIYFAPASHTQVIFKAGGNVGIGTMNPDAKLAVNGTIHAKEVIVDTSSAAWSDYVFAPDYRLAPLSEIEQHIKSDGHLPGIPSAADVAEHGVTVGEMQAKLLAKIEELTLHQIAQEKRIDRLEQENHKLKAELENR